MKTALVITIILLLASFAAAWPSDPTANMAVCSRNGEQVIPKIAATSDGGCYISWEDNSSGNYDIYLQRINPDGDIIWEQCGILVDGQPQDTWITDYDMTVDQADNCVIVCNDIRTDPARNIYAYRISPDRQMVWGDNGIALSDNPDFEPNPQVVATSFGNFVIAWEQDSSPSRINLRKLTPDGTDMWDPPVISMTANFGMSIPRLAPADSDAVILEYLVPRATGMWALKHIKAQKFSAGGQPMWGDTGVFVSTAGGLGPQMWPDLIPDGIGGAYCYWYDAHESNNHHVYVQHLLQSGQAAWAVNGEKASLATGQMQMSPSLVRAPGTESVIAFYQVTDLGQTVSGLGGQMINSNGDRVWGDDGILYAELSAQGHYNVNTVPQADGAMVVYLEDVPGSAVNNRVQAIHVRNDGESIWDIAPQTLCSVISSKGRLTACTNRFNQVIATWTDMRADQSGDLFLQDVNPDGSLGNLGQQNNPPSAFDLISPAADDTLVSFDTHFFWTMSFDPDSGSQVTYEIHFNVWWGDSMPRHTVYDTRTDTTVIVNWGQISGLPEHDFLSVDWWVKAISGTDSVNSNEVWRFTIPEEGAANETPSLPRNFAIESVYPNPFNAEARIRLAIPNETQLGVTLYDILGRQVATLFNQRTEAGYHDVPVNGRNLASGIYLVRAEMGGRPALVQRVVLLK